MDEDDEGRVVVSAEMAMRERALQLAYETESKRPGMTYARVLRAAHAYASFLLREGCAFAEQERMQ